MIYFLINECISNVCISKYIFHYLRNKFHFCQKSCLHVESRNAILIFSALLLNFCGINKAISINDVSMTVFDVNNNKNITTFAHFNLPKEQNS